jgi:predicted dehydrogenase
VSEAQSVLAEARDRKLVVHLNSPGPHRAQDTAAIASWIEAYDLGRPLAFQARTWASYREKPNGSWYDDPEACAAAPILRLGVYFLNEFAHFLGRPRSVHVVQSRIFTQRPTSDHASMTIHFENGAIGTIFASFCIDDGRPWRDEISLNFERGTIERWMERHDETDMGADYARVELRRRGAELVAMRTQPGAFAGWYQWDAFQRAIRNGEGMAPGYVEDILYGVRLIAAMRRSALSGKPEPVLS